MAVVTDMILGSGKGLRVPPWARAVLTGARPGRDPGAGPAGGTRARDPRAQDLGVSADAMRASAASWRGLVPIRVRPGRYNEL